MAEFSKLIITRKGQALIAKIIAGKGSMEFTRVSTSGAIYEQEELEGLTALSDIKQTSLISKIVRSNEVAVKIDTAFQNRDLTAGYYMRTLGLYAADPEEGEILYAVTTETSGNCYMPPYNGVTVSGAYVQLITTVGNADSVSLKVDAAATATIGNIRDLRDNLDRVSIRFDETEPEVRENIQSQDTLGTILRKVHKWLADLRGGAFSAVANNCTTAEEGHVLDARQGKILQEGVEEIRVEVTEVNSVVDQLKKSVADGKALIASAITGKGVSTAADAAFGTMANNIKGISTVPHIGSASGSGSYYVNYDDNQDRRFTGSFNVNLGAVAGKSVVGVYISDTTTTTEPGGYLATYERRTWVSSWNQSTATVSFYFHWNCKFRGTMRCSATLSVIYA